MCAVSGPHEQLDGCVRPGSNKCLANVGSMLVRRRRRLPSIEPTLAFLLDVLPGAESGGNVQIAVSTWAVPSTDSQTYTYLPSIHLILCILNYNVIRKGQCYMATDLFPDHIWLSTNTDGQASVERILLLFFLQQKR